MDEYKQAQSSAAGGGDSATVDAVVVAEPIGEAARIVRESKECPIHGVTVYNDRAEVSRDINLELQAPGDYEILVEGLPDCVDTDSVRVDGSGDMTLQEVSYGTHHKPVVPTTAPSEDEGVVKAQLSKVQDEVEALKHRVSEIERSKALMESFTDAMMSRGTFHKGADVASSAENLADAAHAAFQLLEQQQVKAAQFNDELRALAKAKADKEQLITVLNKRLQELGASMKEETVVSRDVTIVITARSSGVATLRMSYLVSKASWTPAYDARMESENTDVSLTYFGMVKQNTGEDWTNAKLVLSTAMPSAGGSAPRLPQRRVQLMSQSSWFARNGGRQDDRLTNVAKRERASSEWSMSDQERMFQLDARSANSLGGGEDAGTAGRATAQVQGGGAASTFHIARRITIASDNKPHKVGVAVLRLKATFRHYCVPARDPAAYLQCLTTNTSEYTLLASRQVNVFLDNTFICKSRIMSISPGETFRTFLGVDPAVSVEYRRVTEQTQVRGFLSRCNARVFKFNTRIKNNKRTAVRLILADMLPAVDDTTIRVKLVCPTASEVAVGNKVEEEDRSTGEVAHGRRQGEREPVDAVAQMKITNNLVWSRTVAAGATIQVPFEYAIEYPSNATVDLYDVNLDPHGSGHTGSGLAADMFSGGDTRPTYASTAAGIL